MYTTMANQTRLKIGLYQVTILLKGVSPNEFPLHIMSSYDSVSFILYYVFALSVFWVPDIRAYVRSGLLSQDFPR